MTNRSNYWSCSKFADWLRGTDKLKMGTGKEWNQWKRAAQETHPIRYWIVEEGLDYLQNFVNWPMDRIHDVRYYINNRWITRSHSLTAHPRDIKPGNWCDVGNRFLPCLFNELVDFVEIESAWHHVLWDEAARKQYGVPWTRSFFRFRTWRCPEAGINHLKWAMSLTNVEWIKEGETPELTHQALAAKEILELYTWWKEVYPQRPDPHDASGWSEYCANRRRNGYDFFDMEDRTPEEAEQGRVTLDRTREIEEVYEKEDTEMLIRLIKVRDSLWT